MKYKTFIFDFDGTLFDSRIGIISSIKYALDAFDIPHPSDETLSTFIGPPLLESFEKQFNLSKQQSIEALAKLREYYGDKGIFESKPYDGIFELLHSLKEKGFPLAIATAKPTLYTQQILEKHTWQHFFDSVRGSGLNGELYPKERTITEALKDLDIFYKEDVVMVGDTIYDIKGAQECGIDSIAVNYGYGKTQDLKDARPTKLVERVEDLAALLLAK